ncbi:MAG: hypothetical protein CFE41_08760 [Burkholderiales bacterium PBB2]|nr:MAG: hypothetical protein CFE41_08760 [Burkholderiales bacterium PBB2]
MRPVAAPNRRVNMPKHPVAGGVARRCAGKIRIRSNPCLSWACHSACSCCWRQPGGREQGPRTRRRTPHGIDAFHPQGRTNTMAFTSTIFSKTLIGAAAALTLLSAQAAPVSLSYSGNGTRSWWAGAKATGTGSFETNSGQYSGDISYTDLKSFSFHLQIELDGVTENFFYGLDQLSNFWATVDNSGFTNFYLRTEYVRGDQRGGQSLNFGLGANNAFTHHFDIPGYFTTGQLMATLGPDNHVPEPATLALTLAALGLAGVVGRGRRSSQGKA